MNRNRWLYLLGAAVVSVVFGVGVHTIGAAPTVLWTAVIGTLSVAANFYGEDDRFEPTRIYTSSDIADLCESIAPGCTTITDWRYGTHCVDVTVRIGWRALVPGFVWVVRQAITRALIERGLAYRTWRVEVTR